MSRSQDSFNKREREKKRQKKKKEKAERKAQRKEEGIKGPEFMYADEFGNLSVTPPDPNRKRTEIKLEDINISTPKVGKDDNNGVITGIVKFFNDEKGYGFINEKGTNNSYFVHANGLINQIKDNDNVSFELESGPKGLTAVNVKIVAIKKEEKKEKTPPAAPTDRN